MFKTLKFLSQGSHKGIKWEIYLSKKETYDYTPKFKVNYECNYIGYIKFDECFEKAVETPIFHKEYSYKKAGLIMELINSKIDEFLGGQE
jgi:hypothetical protein|nr:MAG TPA: hypothetical protein [Caudoviricetes sp.]